MRLKIFLSGANAKRSMTSTLNKFMAISRHEKNSVPKEKNRGVGIVPTGWVDDWS
jgi:hypothetical protein